MGERGHRTRALLECHLSDKLCIVRGQQYEIIIVPTLLVGGFLILLAVILWLFIRGQRSQQRHRGSQGKAETLVCLTPKPSLQPILVLTFVPYFLVSFLDVMTMDSVLYDLTEKQVYHIGKQVLLALEFLQDKHLFHGDVAARNVLIQSDLTAKLCRLGLAYEVYARGAISSTHTVPLKWLAPERLLLRPASIRGDIWSFGILLYEMVTLGAPPYPEVPPASILQYLQRKKIMKRPSSCTQTMYNIMKSCWRWKEDSRPLPGELRLRLEAAARSANDKAVLQVPELVVPELYAGVAGVTTESPSYSVL
uniref:Serine/threonine/tyrosine kinase 1 n=1 Tax=Jaculus jaculus TaxID=51337 RepID=A0A8C5KM00_JACJA